MKENMKVSCIRIALVCLVTLSSLWGPTMLNAQGPDDAGLPEKVYLPLVIADNQTSQHESKEEIIPGHYIVVFKDDLVSAAGVHATAAEMATTLGGELLQTYDAALNGFAMRLPTDMITDALTTLQTDTRVSYVEPDRRIFLDPIEVAEPVTDTVTIEPADDTVVAATVDEMDTTQTNPVWGLDRIDQRNLPLNRQYNYNSSGAGVEVFVIDSGIRLSHAEFQGRARDGTDTVDGILPGADCRGHGTHVAGTIGGRTVGVAKGVNLRNVRVLDCDNGGTLTQILNGLEYVVRFRQTHPTIPLVANMSLGTSSPNQAIDDAVRNLINNRITVVAAAGNSRTNACNQSPARVPEVITVGATSQSDTRASFSNFGSCVDLFAPGVSILSASHISDTGGRWMNGTSMAAPHVAGVAALYLQSNPSATPAEVANAIINNATTNVVSNPGIGSPNRLLYSQFGTTTPLCYPEFPNLPVIVGTDGNDTNLRGTAGSERICGLTGDDTIYGARGNDAINGNQGRDTVYGERGDDLIKGGQDNDNVNGGPDNDTVYGDLGDDIVNGNQGNDYVAGGDGNDIVRGGQNNDVVLGEAGNDTLYGDNGNDRLWGGAGSDTFIYYAGNGNDEINDFQWAADRLQLYGTTIRNYSQQGATCILTLATGATIHLINVGTCRNPTVSASASEELPRINADLDINSNMIKIRGTGFAPQEQVTPTLNDVEIPTTQVDSTGDFTISITLTLPLTDEYIITIPAYQSVDETASLEVNPVATVVTVIE